MNPIFTTCFRISGAYNSSFVFENNLESAEWLLDSFPYIRQKYGSSIKLERASLPSLKVGDYCNIRGRGETVYRIAGLVQISPRQWRFVMFSGELVDVSECHTTCLPLDIKSRDGYTSTCG